MDFEFRPRPFTTAVAVISALVLLGLAGWQFSRFFEKSKLEDEWNRRRDAPPRPLTSLDQLSAEADDYHQVLARGTIDPNRVAYYDYHRFRGEPGCLVASPIKLDGGGTMLALLGFVPHTRDMQCTEATLAAPPEGELLGLVHTLNPNLPDQENRGQTGETLRFNTLDADGTYDAWGITDRPKSPTLLVLDERHRGEPYPLASYEHVSAPYLTSMRHLNYAGTWLVSLLFVVGIWGGISLRRVQSTEP